MNEILAASYYLLKKTNPNMDIPIIKGEGDIGYLMGDELLDNIVTINMVLADPIPPKPKMADYFGLEPVFSEKIAKVFKSLDDPLMQFFPVKLKGLIDEVYDYTYIRFCNYQRVIDFEKSECEVDEELDIIEWMERMILSEKKLAAIPLEKRLIFRPRLRGADIIFHKSVVEKVMALEPEGIRFVQVEQWVDGMQFE